MKKLFLLVPIFGLLFSCSGEKKQTEQAAEDLQEQVESIEQSTQQLDEMMDSSADELEKTQAEIGSLLNNILN